MLQNLDHFYGFLSLLGVIGIYPVLIRLQNDDSLNPLEEKIKWILFFMLGLFLSRFPYQVYKYSLAGRLTYAFATLLVFSIFLYFETLLRKHMPLLLKFFMAISSSLFIIDSLFLNLINSPEHKIAFGIFVVVALLLNLIVGLFRNRKDYSRPENEQINISLITLLLLVPFYLSDMKVFHDMTGLPHLGVVGGLSFTYIAFFDRSFFGSYYHLLKKFIKSIIFSLILSIGIWSIYPFYDLNTTLHTFVFFLTINLIFRIHYVVKDFDGDSEFFKFIDSINTSDKTNQISFLKDADKFFNRINKKLLRKEDLKNYDIEKINNFFETKQTHLFSIYDIQNALQNAGEDKTNSLDLEIYEQLRDILEKYEMGHILKLNTTQPEYIIFSISSFGYNKIIHAKTFLLNEVSKLIERASLK